MSRTWLHRAIAAALGVAAAGTLMGAKAVQDKAMEREIAGNRLRALKKSMVYYTEHHDAASAHAMKAMVQRQIAIHGRGWQAADLTATLAVLKEKVDPLVTCRAVAILKANHRHFDLKESQEVKTATRHLFTHTDWLVRCYALSLTSTLNDLTARPAVESLAESDPNPFVKEAAAKALQQLVE